MAVADKDEDFRSLDSAATAASQARVEALMTLTSEQLRLLADWLVAEAMTPTEVATGPCEPYDLVSKRLVQELRDHADFKEGNLDGYISRRKAG